MDITIMKRDSVVDVEKNSASSRRRYAAEFKREVVIESMAPGASIAKVALAHGINANLLHTWRWQFRHQGAIEPRQTGLVAVEVDRDHAGDPSGRGAAVATPVSDRIEVHIGPVRVVVFGRPDAAGLRSVFDALRA